MKKIVEFLLGRDDPEYGPARSALINTDSAAFDPELFVAQETVE